MRYGSLYFPRNSVPFFSVIKYVGIELFIVFLSARSLVIFLFYSDIFCFICVFSPFLSVLLGASQFYIPIPRIRFLLLIFSLSFCFIFWSLLSYSHYSANVGLFCSPFNSSIRISLTSCWWREMEHGLVIARWGLGWGYQSLTRLLLTPPGWRKVSASFLFSSWSMTPAHEKRIVTTGKWWKPQLLSGRVIFTTSENEVQALDTILLGRTRRGGGV